MFIFFDESGNLAKSKGKNGKEFFLTLKNSIIDSKELFESYWVEKWTNKKIR